ncbi:MAG: BglG family transcription antiterminator, partial [Erysipelotrichaceae bacterium]|nr:BglG family transcription antiterminator [Erysipelotrichaceae bacterium]
MLLDSRSKEILDYLLTQYEYVSIHTLMEAFHLSRRSVYYALSKVNEWLKEHHLSPIEIERNKGIFLSSIQKGDIEKKMLTEEKTMYIFSPEERIYVMICLIIQANERVTVEYLMRYFNVSRNTIFTDLKEVAKKLEEYHLTITTKIKQGYVIQGDPMKIRAVFFLYINLLYPLVKSGVIPFFEKEEVKANINILMKIEKELNVTFVEGIIEALALLLPLMKKNEQAIEVIGISKEKIKHTLEYRLIQEYFDDLSEVETCYFALHLLGSRLQSIPEEIVQYNEDEETMELAKILVSEFKRVACVEFENPEEIERTIFSHLRTSLYRYQYGIQLGNPMMQEIKHQYSSLFEITKNAVEVISLQIGSPIPDSEIAYLTLHFGGFLRAMKTRVETLEILIVCPNGVSTGNMLKGEISNLLPNARIIDTLSVNEYEKKEIKCDFIISTIPLKTTLPVVVVHPILNDTDKIQILKKSMSKTWMQNRLADVDTLFNIMKEYISKHQYQQVYNDLNNYLSSLNQMQSIILEPKVNSLMDFLDEAHITISNQSFHWRQAIHFSCQKLLEEGIITKNYISSIISQLHVYGPYMFITPDVILAHAKSEDGAVKLGCNLVVLKKPVLFSSTREAKMILTLSAPDVESHLTILQNINQVFSDTNNVEKIYN